MRSKLIILIFMLFGLGLETSAQTVLWASDVVEFSSQFGYRQYSARQVRGRPNILPNLGLGPNAWSPKSKNKTEYIKVAFDSMMHIQQVAVAEVHNPGGITHIYAYDEKGQEYLIRKFKAKHLPIEGRLFRYFFNATPYKVSAIKIVIDGKALPGHFGVDAIGVSDSNYPITVSPNITDAVTTNNEVEILGPSVNSIFNELRPVISADGKTMYFSRQNHPENTGAEKDDEDIWYSTQDSNGNWKEAVNIGHPLNTKGPNFVSSVIDSGDSTILLLGNHYYGRHKMAQGLSMSISKDSVTWKKPKQIHIVNDHNKSDKANYFLTPDHTTLIMSVERTETHGSRDLYVSFKEKNEWTEPINMGEVVNSADEEAAPFLATDGKTLFFSSKGFSGFGGYDIYMTRRLDSTWTNWSEPENIGGTFNSEVDDIFFNYVNSEDEYAYFVRGTEENTDIARIKLPYFLQPVEEKIPEMIVVRLNGNVYDEETIEPLQARIEFVQKEGKEVKLVTSKQEDGYYEIFLEKGDIYVFEAKTEDYHAHKDSIDLRGIARSTEVKKDIFLRPLEKNIPFVMHNVNFDFDSHELREESFPDLNRLVQLMFDNPDIKIKISGHTCDIGTHEYNQNLSERRASTITEYILSQEVHEGRVTFEGYGETAPVIENHTEDHREINRRVEFIILEDGKHHAASKPKSLLEVISDLESEN